MQCAARSAPQSRRRPRRGPASASCRRRRSKRRGAGARRADGARRTRRTRSRRSTRPRRAAARRQRPQPRARRRRPRSCATRRQEKGVYGPPRTPPGAPGVPPRRRGAPAAQHGGAVPAAAAGHPAAPRPGPSPGRADPPAAAEHCVDAPRLGRHDLEPRAAPARADARRRAALSPPDADTGAAWHPSPAWRRGLFWTGIAMVVLALNSPIDELGERDFFFIHMLQHVVLGDLAPLCFVAGLTGPVLRPVLALRPGRPAPDPHAPVRGLADLGRSTCSCGTCRSSTRRHSITTRSTPSSTPSSSPAAA